MTDENQEGLPADEGQPVDDGQPTDEGQLVDEGQPADEGQPVAPAAQEPDHREELIRLKVENEYLKRNTSQPQVPDYSRLEEERAEKQRMELMTPEERTQYQMMKEIKELKSQNQQTQLLQKFQMADAADRSSYLERASSTDKRIAEAYSRNMGEVEKRLAEYRKNGVYPTRDEVLKLVLGEQALSTVAKGPNKPARQAAQNRIVSTQGKPIVAAPQATSSKSSANPSLTELRDRAFSDWKKQKGTN